LKAVRALSIHPPHLLPVIPREGVERKTTSLIVSATLRQSMLVIPREGVERSSRVNEFYDANGFVIPREGVESYRRL
jgi:hypothetical protein